MGLLRRWRLMAWLLAAPLLLIALGGQPFWEAQGRLPPALQQQAGAVLARAGLPDARIVVLDDGRPCAGGTVHGLGPTQVVILNRAMESRPTPELLWATAHEARHYMRHDPLLGAGVAWLLIGLMLLASAALPVLVRRRWPGAPSAPLVLAGLLLGYMLGLPAFNLIQRQVEREADLYGARLVGPAAGIAFIHHEAACFGQAPNPDLAYRLFRLNHPSPTERIAAMGALLTHPDTRAR